MRRHGSPWVSLAFAKVKSSDKTRYAGIDVDNYSAGEIHNPHALKPSAAPDPMGDRCVDHYGPDG